MADGIDRDATVLKELSFGGLIELDVDGRPVSGEVSKVGALPGDPGLEEWKRQPSSLASLQATLAKLQSVTFTEQRILDAMRPKIDPRVFDSIMPKIDPKIFGPKIDPKILDILVPKIDPKVLDAIRPRIDPKILDGIFAKIDPFKGILGVSGVRASAAKRQPESESVDFEEAETDGLGDEDSGEADT